MVSLLTNRDVSLLPDLLVDTPLAMGAVVQTLGDAAGDPPDRLSGIRQDQCDPEPLRERKGLRVVLLVTDLSSLDIDASVLQRTISPNNGFETMALSNGCACYGTGATSLLPAVDRLRSSGQFDHVVVELS